MKRLHAGCVDRPVSSIAATRRTLILLFLISLCFPRIPSPAVARTAAPLRALHHSPLFGLARPEQPEEARKQEETGQPEQKRNRIVTIREAVRIALEQNPEILQAMERIRIFEAERGRSWGIERPEFYYLREGMRAGSFLETRWGLSQRFDFPLTGYYRSRSVNLEVSAGRQQLEWMRTRIRAEVKMAYTDLAWADHHLELARKEMELAVELVRIARIRLEAGETGELDLIQAEMEQEQARSRLSHAEDELRDARNELLRLMGVAPQEWAGQILFPDTLAYVEPALNREMLDRNLELVPGMRAAELQRDAGKEMIRAARSGYLPDLRLDLYRQNLGTGFQFSGIEVGISVPLWFLLEERSENRQARARFRQMQWQVDEIRLKLFEEAESAWNRYQNSRQRLLVFKERVEERSGLLLELTQQGYLAGEIDLLRVLEAQRTWLESRTLYYRTLRDYHHHLIELERFLPVEIVFTNNEANEHDEAIEEFGD